MKNKFLNSLLDFPSKVPIYALIAAMTGLLMLILPLEALPIVLRIAGILTVLYAIFRIASVFLTSGGLFSSSITIFALIGIILLGFTLALTPEQSAETLGTLVGAYLLIDGAVGLVKLLLQRSQFYSTAVYGKRMSDKQIVFLAVLSTLMIVSGLLLSVIRIGDNRLGEVLCAIALIYAAGERIFFAYSEYKTKEKRSANERKNAYIEADFEDKTDKG